MRETLTILVALAVIALAGLESGATPPAAPQAHRAHAARHHTPDAFGGWLPAGVIPN